MKKTEVIIGIFIILLTTSVSAIFFENFESNSFLTNNWTLIAVSGGNNWTISNINPYNGTYHGLSQPMSTTEPASIIQKEISTIGYRTINFSYYRKLVGLDIADEFKVKWSNGTSWITVEETLSSSANDIDYIFKKFSLPSSADNIINFAIRFECTAGAVSETCRIDNIQINGTLINTSQEIYGVNISTNFITSSITSENINATYLISIGNKGTSENTYDLTVNNINSSDIALVNQSTITLNAGAVGNIILYVADETPDSYQVTVTATDSNNPNITATTETITTMVKDTKPPTYSNDTDDSLGNVIKGTIVKISVLWKDNKKLDTVIFRTNQNGEWNNISTCLLNSKSEWCNKTIDTSDSTTETICWNQYASDNFENWNLSMPETIHCFNVVTPDTTPPSSTTNLQNQSNGLDFIYWTWTNPTDPDYLKNIIYLNNVNILNTSNNFYNATNLLEDTEYTIKIHTIDTNNNINNTNVTNTARTLKSPCVENWDCTEWDECINGTQTRICTDLNSCGTELNKPIETQECVMPCEEDWICNEWSSCINSTQTRTCNDLNNCNTVINKPEETQNCTIENPNPGGGSGGGGGGSAPSTAYQTEATIPSVPKVAETKAETITESNLNNKQPAAEKPEEKITSSVVKEPSFIASNLAYIITSIIIVILAIFIYRNEVKDL